MKDSKACHFWTEDGLILTRGRHVYVPLGGGLRCEVLQEHHDSMWIGHQGVHRTQALIEHSYYWPKMRDDIEKYVRTCLVCQQDKVEHQ